MSDSRKDARGGHRKATSEETHRRHWHMIPYGRGHFSFYQDFRGRADTRAMRGRIRQRVRRDIVTELANLGAKGGE